MTPITSTAGEIHQALELALSVIHSANLPAPLARSHPCSPDPASTVPTFVTSSSIYATYPSSPSLLLDRPYMPGTYSSHTHNPYYSHTPNPSYFCSPSPSYFCSPNPSVSDLCQTFCHSSAGVHPILPLVCQSAALLSRSFPNGTPRARIRPACRLSHPAHVPCQPTFPSAEHVEENLTNTLMQPIAR